MRNLIRYVKRSWGYLLLMVVMLFLQAYCELELPNYTSKIVNNGIQQKGIEDGVPQQMRASTMKKLNLLLEEEEQELLLKSYEQAAEDTAENTVEQAAEDTASEAAGSGDSQAEPDYVLRSDLTEEERTTLNETLSKAELLLYYLTQENGFSSLLGTADAETQTQEDGQTQGEQAAADTGLAQESEETDEDSQTQGEQAAADTGLAQESEESDEDGQAQETEETGQVSGKALLATLELLPESLRGSVRSRIYEQLDGMPETLTEQTAILFVQEEYEALGIDLDSMQIRYLLQIGGKMLLLALLGMLAAVLTTFCSARAAATTAHDLRNAVYRKVIGFTSEEFNTFSTASLITRSTNDIQQVQLMLAMGFRILLYSPILAIGGILKVLNSDASMSWIIALAVGLILILIVVLFTVAMPKFTKLQTLIDRLNLVCRESLTGVMVTRAFSAEQHEEERFEKANRDLTRTNLFVNRCMTFMMPVMMLIMNGISVLIVYFGARSVDAGTLQVGDMMAFIQYAMQIIMSFLMICAISVMVPRANVAAKRIHQVLSMQPSIRDPEQPVRPDPKDRGCVEFDHVFFAYPGAGEMVLEDISFRAKKGQTVAIIGSTGSGKSTLVNLIPRLFDVTQGAVRVDGVDVRDMAKEDLCGRLGYVPQKSVLFSGTIASNIRYGAPDASDQEVRQAAAIAQAEDFILAKEDQYQSGIAQGGTNVSGGQKQRLAIARAIAKKPEILIFDDSFSALDYQTDVALRKALKQSAGETTTLIVAQRISTILHADQIIVLEEGRIAGRGTHRELMQTCEVYRQIATSQLSEEELAQ